MKKNLLTIVLGGLVASFAFAGSAQASHFKKSCKPACPPAPVCVQPAPVVCVQPAPVACAPKKCHFKLPKCHFKLPKCHKAPVVCETVVYAAPVAVATPQASAQN